MRKISGVMNVLGQFASLAYQTLGTIDDLNSQIAAREKAEARLRELTRVEVGVILMGWRRKFELGKNSIAWLSKLRATPW